MARPLYASTLQTTSTALASITSGGGIRAGTGAVDLVDTTGKLSSLSPTYVATLTSVTAGKILRSDGVTFVDSVLKLPNAATSGRVVFASATDTYGENAALTFDSGTGTLSATTFSGTFTGTVTVTADATNATRNLVFCNGAGAATLFETAGLTFNPSTNTLTTTTFVGALTGNASTSTTLQTARDLNGTSFNGSASITVPLNVGTTASNTTWYPVFTSVNTGNTQATTSASFTFNPFTNTLTATTFVGALTGNVTGNASTATALQNARTIGGVSFDGTANITVSTATAGFTVSGGTLASGAHTITSGTLTVTGASTDLEAIVYNNTQANSASNRSYIEFNFNSTTTNRGFAFIVANSSVVTDASRQGTLEIYLANSGSPTLAATFQPSGSLVLAGSLTTASVTISGTSISATNLILSGGGGLITLSDKPKFGGTNTTGAGSAALGTNSPATTNTAPYTWIQAQSSDGSTVYFPVWK